MSNQIPERLIAFNAYDGNNVLLGVVDVELPEIVFMSDTVSGTGIMGEIDSTTIGHTEGMETTINYRTVIDRALKMLSPKGRTLTFRAAQQIANGATGASEAEGLRVTMTVKPKSFAPGTLAPAATTDSSSVFSVTYIAIYLKNKEHLVIDKLNQVFRIEGVDYYAPVRNLL